MNCWFVFAAWSSDVNTAKLTSRLLSQSFGIRFVIILKGQKQSHLEFKYMIEWVNVWCNPAVLDASPEQMLLALLIIIIEVILYSEQREDEGGAASLVGRIMWML